MKISAAALCTLLMTQAHGQGPTVANYAFVTDFSQSYLRADLDVKLFSKYVDLVTQSGFDTAKALYAKGAHFGTQAIVSVASPGTTVGLANREALTAPTQSAGQVNLTSSTTYAVGTTNLTLVYAKSADCVVGALLPADQTTAGCLAASGNIKTNTSVNIPYTLSLGNMARRNMQVFAGTNTSMRGTDGKFFPDFQIFLDYYGAINYADILISAALDGKATNFTNGNADFTGKPFNGRNQVAKKGAAYMMYYMHAIRYFYLGQQLCGIGAFEEGVALFIGSSEGPTGTNGSGYMPYTLGDKRCPNFKTCGSTGNETTGTSKVNLQLIEQFKAFKAQYSTTNCTLTAPTLLPIVTRITQLMKVPMVQGTLRYAEIISTAVGEVPYAIRAEGGIFAAGILPYIYKCDQPAATTIYKQVWTGTGPSVFIDVKAALEKNYECLGISCSDVGGIVDDTGNYKNTTRPCGLPVVKPPTKCLKRGQRCKSSSKCCSKRCRWLFRICR